MQSKVDKVYQEIESFTPDEVRDLLSRLAHRLELLGWLKVATLLLDWDNGEDSVYDQVLHIISDTNIGGATLPPTFLEHYDRSRFRLSAMPIRFLY